MMRLTVPTDLQAELESVQETAELCDTSGRVVGYFIRSLYQLVDCPLSEEELQRRAGTRGGRPLKDILADLEKMG